MKNFLLLFILSVGYPVFAGQFTISDSLKGKSYSFFEETTFTLKDTAKLLVYGRAWLEKARNDTDYKQQAAALRIVMYASDKRLRLKYLDTLMNVASRSNDSSVIGKAWLTKGIYHYNSSQHVKALDSYMKADEFLSQSADPYDVFKLKYAIAITKYYLGFYDEAIALLNQCRTYFSEEDARGYLNTLHALALCYTQLRNYKESDRLNTQGLAVGEEVGDDSMKSYFWFSQGINAFYL